MTNLSMILAQVPPPATPATPQTSNPLQFLPIALIMGVMVYMVLSRSSQVKREKREREDLLSKMSKNDRVLTLGGIIGTVVQVKDNEVILKVDENTNTKMTFLKSAVQRILTDDAGVGEKG